MKWQEDLLRPGVNAACTIQPKVPYRLVLPSLKTVPPAWIQLLLPPTGPDSAESGRAYFRPGTPATATSSGRSHAASGT